MRTVMAVGDLSGAVTGAASGLSGEYLTVAGAAVAIGLVPYGVRRVWGLFKGLAK